MAANSKDAAKFHNNILLCHRSRSICVLHTLKLGDHPFVAHAKGRHKVILGTHKEGKIGEGPGKAC